MAALESEIVAALVYNLLFLSQSQVTETEASTVVPFFLVSNLVDGSNLPMAINPVNGEGNCMSAAQRGATAARTSELAVRANGNGHSFPRRRCAPTSNNYSFCKLRLLLLALVPVSLLR